MSCDETFIGMSCDETKTRFTINNTTVLLMHTEAE
jgi:hypothetical protein